MEEEEEEGISLFFHISLIQIVQIVPSELYDHVARVAHALRSMGVEVGDRVVGFVPNCPYAAIAMLATTRLILIKLN